MKPLRPAGRRSTGGAALLALLLLCGGCALPPKPLTGPTQTNRNSALGLVVDAPSELRPLLERHLDLARLQSLQVLAADETIDASEWSRLIGVAPAQARDLLQTEGYFDAQVSVQRMAATANSATATEAARAVDTADSSVGLDGAALQVRLKVDPGPRTQVRGLQVAIIGELQRRIESGDTDAVALGKALPTAGALRAGRPFRNADWADTKQQLLARLRAAGYAAANLASSQADVDAPSQRADLHLVLDSGPLFFAGPVLITGLQHHEQATVAHLAGFGAGAPLTEARLLDYQERLQKTGLFEAVSVSFEPDIAQAGAAPVRVRLTELPLQQATAGVGYSANTGQRATLEHTQRRLLGLPLTAYNKLEWGRDLQRWTGDYLTHPGEGFYRNLVGGQVERVIGATDVVLSQRLRLGRTQDTPRIERLVFAEWLRSRRDDLSVGSAATGNGLSIASAISGNVHLVLRQLDSVLLPTRGLSLALQGGAGEAGSPGGASGPFARLYGRLTGYLPLGQSWYGQARLELGQIVKSARVAVPDALGFRAGGDDSVRGYGFRSLAPTRADGSTISGQSLLTASAEVARPIMASMPALWGALFVDGGRAVDRWGGFRPALGYGAGLRWRSPIGPLRADLAWGQDVHKLRLHLSVGIAF